MADINVKSLQVLDATRPENDPRLNPGNQGPPMGLLQSRARNLGAFNLDNLVGKFNPENITMRQRKMMRRDPMIHLGLHFRKNFLVNAPYRIVCEDPQITAFVEGAIGPYYGQIMRQMLLKFDYGYQPIVKNFRRAVPDWTYEDPISRTNKDVWTNKDIPALLLDHFQALPPDGARPLFSEDGKRYLGFEHMRLSPNMDGSGGTLKVDRDHALWVINENDESYGDWFGYPLTGYVYRYWWSYWYRFLLADRHFEQDADPPLMVSYPPGTGIDPDDSSEVDNYVIALKVGMNLRDGGTIAMPSDYYEQEAEGRLSRGAKKWDAVFLRGGENMKAFQESFNYLDVLKLRGLLVPENAVIPPGGRGGGDTTQTLGDLLVESMAIEMQELDKAWNEEIIRPLVAQNFVDPPRVEKVTENFRDEDKGLANELLNVISSQDPGALQINWREVARLSGLPLLTEEQLKDPKFQVMSARQKAADAADSASGHNPGAGETQDGDTRKKNPNPKGPTGGG